MQKVFPRSVTLLATAIVLAGCSSLKPLASRPPAAAITLAAPVTIHRFLGGETILPAGEYKPTLEDNKGFYYTAPAKIISNDTVSWQLDGGLYVPKGSTTPTHYYVVGQHHATSLYRLKEPPRYELKR